MQYLTKVILVVFLSILLTGCGTAETSIESVGGEDAAVKYAEQIHAMNTMIPSYSQIMVHEKDGVPEISVFNTPSDLNAEIYQVFASEIYQLKSYCNANFEEYKISIVNVDPADSSIPLAWNSSFSDWGTLIDKRSGETVVSSFNSLGDVCSFFPSLTQYINISLLDKRDADIYLSVTNALAARANESEDAILKEFSEQYGLSEQQMRIFIKDMMGKVHSSTHSFPEKTPIIFPAKTESSLFTYFPSAPDVIFSTDASENGLENNIYAMIGIVKSYGSIVVQGENLPYFVLETENGNVLFHDTYGLVLAINKEAREIFLEEDSDYSFPSVGDTVKVYGVYQGYSSEFDMPSFIYGIPKWIEQ